MFAAVALAAALGSGWHAHAGARASHAPAIAIAPLPTHLRDAGLYADPAHAAWNAPVARGLVAFSPQYPLWSDGSHKRRWLSLPPGTSVDAHDPAAWRFPAGTRLFKEFAFDRPVETRMLERLADGQWRYASYVWNAEGTDAVLAPATGIASLPAPGAPGGTYAIPSTDDCRGCHEGAAVPPLGFSALQLSGDRDPLAPHADAIAPADLRSLARAGLLRGLPADLLAHPPRIDAATPTARAALGYLHANCGHCHNRGPGRVPVQLALAEAWTGTHVDASAALATLAGPSRFRLHDSPATQLVVPGDPEASLLPLRMRSLDPRVRMPPVGTRVVDDVGVDLVKRWIAELQPSQKEPSR